MPLTIALRQILASYYNGLTDNSLQTARGGLIMEHTMDIMDTIREQIEGNRIILYMKGSPNQPQCGFSARTVQALMSCGERFAYVDVLSNPEIRANLPAYANWPTFPQLWVDGELVGGCDIVCDMEATGELKALVSAGSEGAEA
jgi:monothiol glutaredoxin